MGRAVLRAVAVRLLAGALPAAASAQARPAAPPALLFDGVTVIDVTTGQLLPEQRVVIVGSRIQTVGSAQRVRVPRGAQVVNARGKYLIPGLWDMHLHPGLLGTGSPKGVHITADLAYLLLIANGVTGFRDCWSTVPLDTMLRWRREILAGTRVGPPRQLLSAVAIDAAGVDPLRDLFHIAATDADKACHREDNGFTGHTCVKAGDSADVEQLVRTLKAAGVDWIKTYMLDQKTYFLVAAAARRAGLRFGGHAPYVSPFDAADSGASTLDHVGGDNVGILNKLCFDPNQATVAGCRAVAERFRRTNTWSVPTLSNRSIDWFKTASPQVIPNRLVHTVADFWTTFTYTPGWLQHYERLPLPPGGSNFAYLKIPMEVGLPILSGGDTGAEEAGFKLHAELAILVDRGLTPLAALQAATLNPAKLLRATDSLGTVAPGKLADLVLLDANPLADITNTTMIRAVVANGRYFDRAALDGLLAEIRARAKP